MDQPSVILIIGERQPLNQSLRDWIEMGLPQCRVAQASNEVEAIELARNSAPLVFIIDVDAPQIQRLEALRRIKASMPDTPVMALSLFEDQVHRIAAAEAGASVYVPKSKLQSELVPALKTLIGDYCYTGSQNSSEEKSL